MRAKNKREAGGALAVLAVCAVMASCGVKPAGELPVVDVTKSYPQKDLVLQQIAQVEYVALETREKFLLDGFPSVDYLDDEILVTHNGTGDIMIFDSRTGKGLHSFNRTGRGPGEYPGVIQVAVDRQGGEMFVVPNSITHGAENLFQVYDMEGKHLRSLAMRGNSFPDALHVYDADWMFSYDDGGFQFEEKGLDPQPYVLMSRRDTVQTRLPLSRPARNTMSIIERQENGMSMYAGGSEMVARAKEGLMFSEPGVDTIYHWNPRTETLTPVMVQTPAFNSMETPVGMFWLGETSDYVFLETVERSRPENGIGGFHKVDLSVDKRDGEVYTTWITNADFKDKGYYPAVRMGTPAGWDVETIEAYRLVDALEEGLLSGPLATLAATIKEDDNPVVMIVRFN